MRPTEERIGEDDQYGSGIISQAGEIEDIQTGFENIPATLQRLFSGQNLGKQLLKLGEPEPR